MSTVYHIFSRLVCSATWGLRTALGLLAVAPFVHADLAPQLCKRGKVLVSDDFEDIKTVSDRWFFREHWTVADGVMTRTEIAGANRRVFVKKPSYGDCIIELKFAFRGAKEIRVMTGTPGKYNAVVILWPHGFRVTTARDQTVPHFSSIHGECAFEFKADRFYFLMMEIRGEEILVRVEDHDHAVVGRHPILARERDYFALQVDQPSAAFDEVRITAAGGEAAEWTSRRGKLGRIQSLRSWLAHEPAEQEKIRETIARDKLYRSNDDFREQVKRVEDLKAQAYQQYPEVFASVKEHRKKIDEERKRLLKEDPVYKALRNAINKLKRAEVEMLHLLHPKLKELLEAQYHLALSKAREASQNATAYQVVVANREIAEAKMRALYPRLEQSNEDLQAVGRAAREKVASKPGFKAMTKGISEAVRVEKDSVAKFAASLTMTFEDGKTSK